MITNSSVVGLKTLSTSASLLISTRTQRGNLTDVNTSTSGDENYVADNNISERILIGSFLVILIFLAISGNVLVCIAVFTDRRLKRLNNFFIVSLAVADLWMALVVMSFAIINDISGRWLFGPVFCNIWISSDIMGSTASILNLCVISLDRYIHIRDPLKYARWMNWKKVAVAIVLVWTISFILSFIPIHVGWHKSPIDYDKVLPPDKCFLEISGTYAVVSSTISFYIPCIIMLALYCKLYMYARLQVKSIKSTMVHGSLNDSKTGRGNSSKLSDHKAAVTLGVICGVFLFCWLPFFILNLVEAYCKCAAIILFQCLTWLGYVNSCLNPIIYSIFNSEFRDAFKRILLPRSCHSEDSRDGFHKRSPRKSKNGTSTTSEYLMTRTENGTRLSKDSREPLMDDRITAL